ncbi:colanic acid biosynthesis protein WcaM [Erwinia sp. HR93]|nr:colanic acid biosynthesis protein WcaM [Erwinia sp. HR93]MEA1065406.1 colanic acid biosynthesis protein WcaM [Erwinia sp. HR93]
MKKALLVKALTRRALLRRAAGVAALALIYAPGANALRQKTPVDVGDFYRGDWPAAFRRAFNAADHVVVPKNRVCDDFNAGIVIPKGKTLTIRGGISGNGRGRFVLQDGCQVAGEDGGRINNVTLDVRGSDCAIRGLDMSGKAPVTQIYIGGKEKRNMRNLIVEKLRVHDANYAILRQGFHNQLDGARITHCHFQRLQGDAIEWNVAINDKNILISDHLIEDINCTNGKANWGIGIGLAGSTYDNQYPDAQTVKNFIVANITGRNCRQLVHVENGKHFIIRNIRAQNITPMFSKNAGIDNATIAIYGCDNFTIDNVQMSKSAGMLIGYGTARGRYLSIPQNFRINNVTLDNRKLPYRVRGIQIASGNQTSFVALTRFTLEHANLEIHNKPQHLFLRHIHVRQLAKRGPALKLNFDLRKDVRGHFMAREDTLLSLVDVTAINEKGQKSVDIDAIGQRYVKVQGGNVVSL